MTNDELAYLILSWAKVHHPKPYADTLAVATRPNAFRMYMLRLVEMRYAEDRGFRGTVPVSVLDETSLTIRVRDKLDPEKIVELKGMRAKGPITRRIFELAFTKEEWELRSKAIETLNLEYVHGSGAS